MTSNRNAESSTDPSSEEANSTGADTSSSSYAHSIRTTSSSPHVVISQDETETNLSASSPPHQQLQLKQQQQQQQQYQQQQQQEQYPDEFQWIQHVSFPAFIVDPKNNFSIAAWNPSIARWTKIPPRDAVCRPIQSVVSFFVQQEQSSYLPNSTSNNNNNNNGEKQNPNDTNCCWWETILEQLKQTNIDEEQELEPVRVVRKVRFSQHQQGQQQHSISTSSSLSNRLYQIQISAQYSPSSTNQIIGLICMLLQEEFYQKEDDILSTQLGFQQHSQTRRQGEDTPILHDTNCGGGGGDDANHDDDDNNHDDNDDDDHNQRQIFHKPLENGIRHPQSSQSSSKSTHNNNNNNNNNDDDDDDDDYETSAKEYRLLFETANAPIFGVDTNGRINEWNHRIADITGIPKHDAIGRPLLEDDGNTFVSNVMHQDVQIIVQQALLQGQGTSNFELEIVTHHPRHHSSVQQSSLSIQRDDHSHTSLSMECLTTTDEDWQGPFDPLYHEDDDEEQDDDDDDDDDHHRFLLVNVTPRRNLQNEIVGAIFMGEDVTDACNHDRAVAAMANELHQLIETANAPIFGIDCDGYVNKWNNKTAEITGYSKEEAFDSLLIDNFIVPDIHDSVHDVFDTALDGRATSIFEVDFVTKSNEIRHLLVNVTPQQDLDGTIIGVVAIAQDVTEAVQRDRAVAGMALELRQLIDTANAPIFGIDTEGNVNEWNRRTSDITGYSKEEAFDEPLVETFIAPSMQAKVQEILDSALVGNETSNYELEFVSKSGEPIFLLVNATTRRDPENTVVGVVGVAQDVSEDRKHAQALREMQTLRASQEAKVEMERNMTAYFAHELRNPLGAIDSALNAMPDDLPESARSLVSGMQLCTGFMSSIMNNLLDVRKMEEGKMQLNQVPISLRQILNNVHKMLEPSVRPGVEFRKVIDIPKGKSWVLGDSHRIQQVLTNVVTNAIKYTVSGYIELTIGWENDDKVKFVCDDTGPGIPKSEQEMLFQRFVQRGGAPGTGLGLAIAKHLVDLTGGSIRFDSDPSVRAGTKCIVTMSLPLCEAPDHVIEESTELITEPIFVLIIDDIKMNRVMLKRRIQKGIAPNSLIMEAATGEEALEICGKNRFNVIIVDQYMEEAGGVMVGTDVVFAMRRMRIDSVIIGCSGNDMGSQFLEAGADWVWQKPLPSNGKIIQDLRTSMAKRDGRLQQQQQQVQLQQQKVHQE
ncbi:PAS domain S-box containing protein [Nitzschia inconspicua]|uniref:histidine kinase n=1 Tax=Nitzschia inconspicua TaxID=303405 RepID=A0A9K3PAK9_9STRA|nr:PAS domain S-box containing protein [Nitzschia inconspicua]